eukprot:gene6715-9208_t
MDAIRELTNTINIFVQFFQSINCLFWQIRWLEDNIRGSSSPLLLIVFVIIVLCLILTFDKENSIMKSILGQNIQGFDTSYIVYIFIIGLIGWFLYKRFSDPTISATPIGNPLRTDEVDSLLPTQSNVRDDIESEFNGKNSTAPMSIYIPNNKDIHVVNNGRANKTH